MKADLKKKNEKKKKKKKKKKERKKNNLDEPKLGIRLNESRFETEKKFQFSMIHPI